MDSIYYLSQVKYLPTQDPSGISGMQPGVDVVPLSAIPTLFSNILFIAVPLIGLAAFVMLISGGLKFLTSGGDQKALEQAKGTITWAILGIVLAIGAYLILMYIGNFLGVEPLKFVWPT